MNALQCARYVFKTEGIRGFYRGLTASYAGISETMICFLIYETLKKHLAQSRFTTPDTDTEKGASDFLGLMAAAAFAKGCASCIAYPHGRLLPVSRCKPASASLWLKINNMNLECCWLFQQHAVIHNEMNCLKHLRSSFELIQKII